MGPQVPEGSVWQSECKALFGRTGLEEPMSEEEAEKTLKQELETTRDDVRRVADEIRVKLHLAGMDAKSAWDEIEPKLTDFERRFDAKADVVSEELKALGSEIKQRLLKLKEKLSE